MLGAGIPCRQSVRRKPLLVSMAQGITIADPNLPDCPLMYVNEAFCRMTGYEREEIVGRNCRFLQGPDTDPAAVARIRQAMQEARPVQMLHPCLSVQLWKVSELQRDICMGCPADLQACMPITFGGSVLTCNMHEGHEL